MFNLANILFFVVFFFLIGAFIYTIMSGAKKEIKNANSPVLTVDATIITKRTHISNDFTTYYATFQVDSGDRFELCIDGEEYGLLDEEDYGKLTFQGERYISFERMDF